MAAGRPTTYTNELADMICEGIEGGKSMITVLAGIPDAPNYATVSRWLIAHDEFRAIYARARTDQADYNADRIAQISEGTLTGDYDPAAARVAMDGMKWIAAKLKPRVYGDKVQVAGDPDGVPIQTQMAHKIDLSGLSLEELDVLEKVMRGAGTKLPQDED